MFNAMCRIALWFLLCTLLIGCTTTAKPSIAGAWGLCSPLREDEHTQILGVALECKETFRFLEDGTFLIYPENTIRLEKAVAQTRGTYKVLSAKQQRDDNISGELRLILTAPVSAKVRVSYLYQVDLDYYGKLKAISLTADSEHLPCQSCTLYKFVTVATSSAD